MLVWFIFFSFTRNYVKKAKKHAYFCQKIVLFIWKSGRFLFLLAGDYPQCYNIAQIHLYYHHKCWYGFFLILWTKKCKKKFKKMHILAKNCLFHLKKWPIFVFTGRKVSKVLQNCSNTSISSSYMLVWFIFFSFTRNNVKRFKNVKNLSYCKKTTPPHGMFCRWPITSRNVDHICKVCSDDLSDLPQSIYNVLHMVWACCTLSKCVKNAIFRKNDPPQQTQCYRIPAYIWNENNK